MQIRNLPFWCACLLLLTACQLDNPFKSSNKQAEIEKPAPVEKVAAESTILSANTTVGYGAPTIAVNSKGDVLTIWRSLDRRNDLLYYSYYDKQADSWSSVKIIEDFNLRFYDRVQLYVANYDFLIQPYFVPRSIHVFNSTEKKWQAISLAVNESAREL